MNNKWILAVILIFVVAIGAYFALGSENNETGNVIASDFTISLSEISTTAKFYEQNGVKFFAVKANDGTIKTGFDACDVCYGSRKGYRQEGDDMVCNNCGNRYPITGLGTENKNPDGCWPGYLPSAISGNNLVIKQSDIDAGKWRF